MKRIFPLVFGLLGVVLVASSSLAQSAGFVELFQGAPAAPEPYKNPHNWDIFVQGFNDREPSLAQHGPNCEPPGFPYAAGNTHPMHSAADAVFLCANHVMTSPGIAGYAAIYMTPPAVMDFSGGSSTLRWNMSTLRTAARDWVDVVITPWQERSNLAYNNNDQHIPPDNIHISLAGTNVFLVTQRTGGSLTYQGTSEDTLLAGDGSTTWDQVFARAGLSESPARRDTFEVVLTQTTISLCMPGYQTGSGGVFCWVNTQLPHALDPAVWNGHASVIFGDRTYNAEKSCTAAEDQFNIVHNPQGDAECPPDTWHWSDVSITPALSATIIPSVPQGFTTNSTDPTVVSFASPVPAGSSLSFTTFSHTPDLRVSFDGGRSWQAPRIQPANAPNNGASEENGEQVWTSVPAGTQQIMVRGSNGFWGGFEAEAFTLNAPPDGIPQRTPVPTATLLPATPTPAAPTSTPVPLPTGVPATLTPAPTVAATVTPTVAPTVEPSATLTPSACVAVSVDVTINGVPQERAEYCQ